MHKSKVCFTCLLPSGGHDELHPAFGSGKAQCLNPNVAWAMAELLWFNEKARDKVKREFGVEWKDLKTY